MSTKPVLNIGALPRFLESCDEGNVEGCGAEGSCYFNPVFCSDTPGIILSVRGGSCWVTCLTRWLILTVGLI